MNEITLTQEEISVIEKQLSGKLNLFFGDEHEKELFAKITEDADNLMRELDAYDELNGNLILWYYNKYKEQQV